MDAKTTAKYLQTQLNRYIKVTGLAPLAVDGVIGKATATAVKMALNEIIKLAAPNVSGGAAAWADWHKLAWGYITTVDTNDPSTVTNQAYALADLFQKFGNFAGSPILPDQGTPSTSTSVATTTPKPPITMPGVGPGAFVPSTSPPVVSIASTSINFLGLKVPRVALYVGGGLFALVIVALVATRKKPSGSVQGSEWWEAEDVDPDVRRIHRESQKRTQQLIREVSSSKRAALEWLERVGSWPSSDPDVRKITAAAERRAARG